MNLRAKAGAIVHGSDSDGDVRRGFVNDASDVAEAYLELLAVCESVLHGAYLDDDVINRHPSTSVSCKALRAVDAALAKSKEKQ